MARCMLCSSSVADTEVVCPRCGGATESDGADLTHVLGGDGHGIDLTKVAGPPTAETGWPGEGADPSPGWSGPSPGWSGPPPGSFGPPGGLAAVPPGPPSGAPPVDYGYGYGPPPVGYGWPGYVPPVPSEGLALGAFLTSLIGLVMAFGIGITILACPVGAVLGHVALRRIAENGKQGHGLALAGVIIGWFGTALLVLGTAIIVALVASAS